MLDDSTVHTLVEVVAGLVSDEKDYKEQVSEDGESLSEVVCEKHKQPPVELALEQLVHPDLLFDTHFEDVDGKPNGEREEVSESDTLGLKVRVGVEFSSKSGEWVASFDDENELTDHEVDFKHHTEDIYKVADKGFLAHISEVTHTLEYKENWEHSQQQAGNSLESS